MERFLLARHAQAEGRGRPDPPLSPLGVRQARLLADRLADSDVREVLHGPARRAQETADVLAQRLECPRRSTDLLTDRTPFPSADRWDDYPRHRWEFLHDVPEDERDEDGVALAESWARLTSLEGAGTIVAITHGFVVGSFVGLALGAPTDAWMTLPIDNASVTDLRPRPGGEWSVAGVNDSGHLSL